MNEHESELVVVLVKHLELYSWYRSDRELWVLDRCKWAKAFIDAGYAADEADDDERFGIPVVNEHTASNFLSEMNNYKIPKSKLENALALRFPTAESWWDVGLLFPIMYVNFDKKHVSAFYPDGIPMERYVPDGWTSEFEDFAMKCSEEDLPSKEKFWVQNGIDMLKVLNERGAELEENSE